MEKSFREILSSFLEEKSSSPLGDSPKSTAAEPAFLHQINFQDLNKIRPRRASMAYPAPIASVKGSPAATKRVSEPTISLSQLSANDRQMLASMIHLGAQELEPGLSKERLKKAYRRLAKALHPDTSMSSHTGAQFLELQKAYRHLSAAISSICDNGSASAPTHQHRDAA